MGTFNRLLAALVVAAGTALPALAQPGALPPAVRAAADAISAEQLAWDLAVLASDENRGRNTPSPGFDAAADYIAARLQRAGLKPAGDAGTFRQHYELRESRVDTDAATIEIEGRRFAFGREFAMRSLAGPVSGVLPVVYVGHGWVIADRTIDPYAGVDVRGKLVLAHGPRALPRGVDVPQIGRVSVGAQTPLAAAAARGAAGVIFITQASELVRWDAVKSANTVRRELEPPVASAYEAAPITSVLLTPPVTTALLDGEILTATAAMRLGDQADYPASFQLKKTIRLHLPVAASTVYRPYNVVAVLEGSDPERKAEVVTVFAHLDGAVGSSVVEGDAIYNSADDNASGSAAMLSIAEQMAAAPKPKRTIVFVWDSGEEQGLWGTRWFVHSPPFPLTQVVAHFNVDMIGASRRPGSADSASPGVTERHEVFLIGPQVAQSSSLGPARSRERRAPEAAIQPAVRSTRERVFLSADRCRAVSRARHSHHRIHHRHPRPLSPACRRSARARSDAGAGRDADGVHQPVDDGRRGRAAAHRSAGAEYRAEAEMTPRVVAGLVMLLALASEGFAQARTYDQLLALFKEWRAFEVPPQRQWRARLLAGNECGAAGRAEEAAGSPSGDRHHRLVDQGARRSARGPRRDERHGLPPARAPAVRARPGVLRVDHQRGERYAVEGRAGHPRCD